MFGSFALCQPYAFHLIIDIPSVSPQQTWLPLQNSGSIRFKSIELPRTQVFSLYSPCPFCRAVVQRGSVWLNHPELMWNYPTEPSPTTVWQRETSLSWRAQKEHGLTNLLWCSSLVGLNYSTHAKLPDRPGSMCHTVVQSGSTLLNSCLLSLQSLLLVWCRRSKWFGRVE